MLASVPMLQCGNASAAIKQFAFTLRNDKPPYSRCSQMGTSLRIWRGFWGGLPSHTKTRNLYMSGRNNAFFIIKMVALTFVFLGVVLFVEMAVFKALGLV